MIAHNLEEALLLPAYVPGVWMRLPPSWVAWTGSPGAEVLRSALIVVSIVPVVLGIWLLRKPQSRRAVWSLLLIQTTLLLNAFWHLAAAALLFRGYSPGLITALLLNLPLSAYLFRRARQEGWLSRRAFLALVPGALVLHGPVLAGLLLLTAKSG